MIKHLDLRRRKLALAAVLEAEMALAKKLGEQVRWTHDAATILRLASAFERVSQSVRDTIQAEQEVERQERELMKRRAETARFLKARELAAAQSQSAMKH